MSGMGGRKLGYGAGAAPTGRGRGGGGVAVAVPAARVSCHAAAIFFFLTVSLSVVGWQVSLKRNLFGNGGLGGEGWLR